MKKAYLIRHGLPEFPQGERMCLGSTDIPLGAEGLAQARNMAARLPPVTAVFSSPLSRALQTARAIGGPITVLEDLREMHAGQWDGLTFAQIRSRYPSLFEARGKDPTIPLPDAEDHQQAAARFRAALEAAARQSPGDFAVVAHGGVIFQFLTSIGARARKPDYAEILCLQYENGKFTLQEESDHA